MTRTSDMPTTTPAAGSLSDIRLSMLATCAGAHHGHVTEISFVWLARPVATLRGGCHLMPGCSSELILLWAAGMRGPTFSLAVSVPR